MVAVPIPEDLRCSMSAIRDQAGILNRSGDLHPHRLGATSIFRSPDAERPTDRSPRAGAVTQFIAER